MDQKPKIIMLADVIENKLRKEQELEFYQKELEKLQEKMFWIKRDIEVNNIIIDMIKNENVIDLKTQAEDKLLLRPKNNADD